MNIGLSATDGKFALVGASAVGGLILSQKFVSGYVKSPLVRALLGAGLFWGSAYALDDGYLGGIAEGVSLGIALDGILSYFGVS